MPPRKSLPLKDFATVKAQTRVLLKRFQSGAIARKSNWIDEAPAEGFFDIERNYFTRPPIPFQPFARKVKIPAGDKVIFHGDFHGDIRSFVSTLKWLNENELLDGFKLKAQCLVRLSGRLYRPRFVWHRSDVHPDASEDGQS